MWGRTGARMRAAAAARIGVADKTSKILLEKDVEI